jgi:hypothetical protein
MAMELKKNDAQIESEVIEALFKLRTKDPELRFLPSHVEPKLLFVIKKSYLLLIEMHNLMMDDRKAHIVSDLEIDLARSLKHIFELLSLVNTHEDILKAYQNISSGTKESVDYSCELLDNILSKHLRDYIFPLIEEISFDEKVKRCKKMLKEMERTESS